MIVQLTNTTKTTIERVVLKPVGPLKIKTEYEHSFSKQLEFPMKAMEKKNIYILLNTEAIKSDGKIITDGRINCITNDRGQV